MAWTSAGDARPPAKPIAGDYLAKGFDTPPNSARPRVWWHWMNGNVSVEGIAKDLEWMKRIGVGGVQTFDANVNTPQIVDKRLVYMTPQWKSAFRFAAEKAESLGLELAIAASPGWSETGGPWVEPADAMKKIVWSETEVIAGRAFSGRLAALPQTAGPYQDVPKAAQYGGNEKDVKALRAYGDIAVFAIPLPASALPEPQATNAGVLLADAGLINDGNSATRVKVSTGTEAEPGTVDLRFSRPQTVRSAKVFIPGQAITFNDPTLLPRLEVNERGIWRRLAEVPLATSATTVAFPPVSAAEYRLVLAPNLRRNRAGIAPRRHPRTMNLAEFQLSGDQRIDQFEVKSGLAIEKDYYELGNDPDAREVGLGPGRAIDLSSHLRADGTLNWTPPRGRWRVVRLGWSLTGTVNHPAPPEATGLEVDKYDAGAVERYLETYLGMYRSATGADLIGSRGLRALLNDSTEVGPSNWTPGLISQFRRLRGYDLVPWLPALAGHLVGTRAQSDGFLYDYRRTLADLHAEAHYGTIARIARAQGLVTYAEALEGRRPTLGDDMAMRRFADVPMAAVWTWTGQPGPAANYLADMKGASSVAHVYGQNLAAAEALTSNMQFWAHSPKELKPVIDLAFAMGINRPVIHTSVHQPVDDKVPGLSLGPFGQNFTRHESWAEMAKPWIDYLSRSAFLLQQGRNVADVAYFYGEEGPLVELYGVDPVKDAPRRYAYDFLNADALLNQASVENGDIVTRGGARYRALYLGGSSQRMTVPLMRKLAELAEGGALIVGPPPQSTPSLADSAEEFASLVARVWGSGKRVVAGRDIEAALIGADVTPAFSYAGAQADAEILFVQRRSEAAEIFFVNNRKDRSEAIEARFRNNFDQPVLCRAETGQCEVLAYRQDGPDTVISLTLDAHDAVFVLFREGARAAPIRPTPSVPAREVAQVDRGWTVEFQPGRGAPQGKLRLDRLVPLDAHADAGIRYFSGVSTYRTSFTLPKDVKPGSPLWLDLGAVGDMAEVAVNGRPAGSPWHAPWRLQIGPYAKRGANSLEIRVANRWVNRLIGDAQPGAAKVTWTSQRTYGANAPLLPAGLIGPVRLLDADRR